MLKVKDNNTYLLANIKLISYLIYLQYNPVNQRVFYKLIFELPLRRNPKIYDLSEIIINQVYDIKFTEYLNRYQKFIKMK